MELILAFLAIFLPLALSPGPANIAIAGQGMSHGFVRGLPFILGVLVAATGIATLSGWGLAGAFLAHPIIYQAVRYGGLGYILHLAWKFLRARPSKSEDTNASYTFFDGVFLLVLNPKMYLAITVLFSQFMKPGESSLWVLIPGLVSVMAFSQLVWLIMGSGFKPLLKSEKAQRIQNVVFGWMMLLAALYLFLAGI